MKDNNRSNIQNREDSFCSVSGRRQKPNVNTSINAGKKNNYGTAQETELSTSGKNIALNLSSCTDRRKRNIGTRTSKLVSSKIGRDLL